MDAFLGFVGAVVLATLGFTWSISAQVNRLRRSLDQARHGVRAVGAQTEGLTKTLVNVLFGLADAGITSLGQLRTVLGSFDTAWTSVVAAELATGNPLAPEQTRRLERYRVQVLQHGRLLSRAEAADLGALLARLARDDPTNPDVWQLDFLGRLLAQMAARSVQAPPPAIRD